MSVGKVSRARLVMGDGLLAPELVGRRFGSLRIVSRKVEGSSHGLRVEVECERCKARHMARFHNMRKRPGTRACPSCNGREPVTVPKWLYQRCQAQRDRCCNPRSTSYERYGARGVEFRFPSVNAAARWIAENLGVADRSMEIDRKDNAGHYEPGNLQWSTPAENMNNNRKSDGANRDRFIAFRKAHPEVRYADATLVRFIRQGLADAEIVERWKAPSAKPKGKYGTFSTLGLYTGSRSTDA